MTRVLASRDWRTLAACLNVDADAFFPAAAPGTDAYARESAIALETCDACPVSLECLDFAVGARIRDGVWGGTTPEDRDAGRLALTRGTA